jgi:hypothetical protein
MNRNKKTNLHIRIINKLLSGCSRYKTICSMLKAIPIRINRNGRKEKEMICIRVKVK